MKIKYAIFYTKDIERIKDFYLKAGFDLESEDKGRFLSFKFKNAVLLGIKLCDKEREIPGSQAVIISVDNIEELYQKMQLEQYDIYKKLTKQDWGTNFSILDPDGNKIEFFDE